ncbi:hypothetical protein FQA39_LY02782 [Lamprigera yunnana]|nr:hypothetical protein FQA39_LY02782 [Lamprigera yunnana]
MRQLVVLFVIATIYVQIAFGQNNCEIRNFTPRYGSYRYNTRILYKYGVCNIVDKSVPLTVLSSERLQYITFPNTTVDVLPNNFFYSVRIDITQLYLNSTSIKIIQPDAFRGLRIKELYLHNNSIHNISQYTFQYLDNLSKMDLSNNYLTNFDNISFDRVSLQVLNVSYNNITQFNFSILPVTLKELNLTHNSIPEVSNLTYQNNLLNLDLSFNAITKITRTKNSLTRLNTLSVANNKLKILKIGMLSNLTNLYRLNLENNLIEEIEIGCLNDLIKLVYLNLSSNNIRTIRHGIFAELSVLKILDISNNAIQYLYESSFYPVTRLEFLNISDNFIQSIDPDDLLSHCPYLKNVNLHNNRWSCSLLSKIIKRFEKSKVQVPKGSVVETSNLKGISCIHNVGDEDFTTPQPSVVYPSYGTSLNLDANETIKSLNKLITTVNNSLEMFNEKVLLLNSAIKNFTLSSKFSVVDDLNENFQNSTFYKFFTADFKKSDFFNYTMQLYSKKLTVSVIENHLESDYPNTSAKLISDAAHKDCNSDRNLIDSVDSLKYETRSFMFFISIILLINLCAFALLLFKLRIHLNRVAIVTYNESKNQKSEAELQLLQ